MLRRGTRGRHRLPSYSLVLGLCCLLCRAKSDRRPDFCQEAEEEEENKKPMSFLWIVRKDPPSFFFGTIHVPYSRVWDHIPDNVKRAFEFAEEIFFELDLTNPSTVSALTHCQLLPQGVTLVDILPRDIYRRLKRHLDYVKNMIPLWMTNDQRGRGLYADYLFNAITGNWEQKRPVWIMLMVNSLTESDIKSRGIPVLDLYLAQQAERLNKLTGAVEKVEEQCVPLNGLNVSQVLFALNQTLWQHESMRAGFLPVMYSTNDLIKHYNCGDLNAVIFNRDTAQVPNFINITLPVVDQNTAKHIDDYFREELIFKRNKRMAERVLKLLIDNPNKSYFFAFGAGHFLGNNTVLDMMIKHGFIIDHIPIHRRIKLFRKKSRGLIKMVPEFRVLRDFSLAPNALGDEIDNTRSSELQPYVRKSSQNLMPPQFPSVPTNRKHRNFNDLWIRLDSHATSSSHMLPEEPSVGEDTLAVQHTLDLWYGLPVNIAPELKSSAILWFFPLHVITYFSMI